jgi:hypothetical protein
MSDACRGGMSDAVSPINLCSRIKHDLTSCNVPAIGGKDD